MTAKAAKTTKKPKSKKIRVGIVGTGIGHAHYSGYRTLPDVEIVGIVDVDEKRAKKIAEDWKVPNAFTSHTDLLEMKDLDAVSVCTPNVFHAPIAIDVLKAGKHVICEKPMAATLEQAEELALEAKKSDRIFMMAFNNRYRGDTQLLKKYIESGDLGDMYYGKTGWVRRHGAPGAGGWFTTKKLSGGGPMIDLGVHALDLTWWLMGKPKPVEAAGSSFFHLGEKELKNKGAKGTFDVEDGAVAHVRFDNGASIMLEVSWILHSPTEGFFCSVMGSEGGASVEPDFRIVKDLHGSPVDLTPKPPDQNGHLGEIVHFIDCIKKGVEPISTAEDGLNVQKMLDAIYRSGAEGKAIAIS